MACNIILLLGDQLSPGIASLRAADPASDVVLIAEVMEEATYVRHHKKKIAFLFSAMRHFAEELRASGWAVDYVKLDDDGNSGSLRGETERAMARHGASRIVVTEPGEWRLLAEMQGWAEATILPDDRFLADRHDFVAWAESRSMLRMEHFYRLMRKKTGLLMDGAKPVGDRWNFDAENRKPAADDLFLPQPLSFAPDAITAEVLDLVERRFPDHFGDLRPFGYAVTREQAEQAFAHFLRSALPDFGSYQDAMLRGQKFLFHAVVSPYLNAGLLDPLDMCRRVEAEWRAGRAPLNSVEGFIRQIIGWREYVRCIYWWQMPGYDRVNHFDAHRPLPGFYWDADTPMACISHCVRQTKEEAYAHHIQRLMVTGNFALLAGIDPHELHTWYLAVYADAYEWVELPNTVGMSQFADGGLLASKPYAASGAYIDRMSDYCGGCHYDVKAKTGAKACPFNLLYWRFIGTHRDGLLGNPRMRRMVDLWDGFDAGRRETIMREAESFLAGLG
jgi:deoxyribodipyrimidine photolyase-related protein